MINKICFKNYKIFKERQELELKPLTIIIGKNNSGKSAVVKLPTLIEESLNTESVNSVNFINGGVELGGELKDLVYGKANRAIEIELESFEDTTQNKLSLDVLIVEDKQKKQTAKIDRWKLNDEMDLVSKGDNNYFIDKNTEQDYRCSFTGFYLDLYFYGNEFETSGTPLEQPFRLKTDYIGSIRTLPERDYRLTGAHNQNKTGIFGENAYQFLISDLFNTNPKLVNNISEWYKTNFEGWGIYINDDRVPIFQIEVRKDELIQNIRDTGIGMSQALPLVTRAFKPCDDKTLIIIEEPETHLHPAAHGNLAELFASSLSDKNKRYLIETHSQNFVLRLRRLVAEGKLNKDSLAIYYVEFDEDSNSSNLERITVDELGKVNTWPEGVFNETLDEAIGIRTAQINKEGYED